VGIICTSSNDLAKNALKNPALENRELVNSTNKNVRGILSIRAFVKNSAMIKIIVAIIKPRTIHPLINARITS
jgi:hypothetical protein